MSNLSITIWSKNRPFQLREFIRTFRKYVKCQNFDMTVIYKYDGEYTEKLNNIIHSNPDIQFVQENNFWNQTLASVMQCKSNVIMFATDDLIFFRKISIASIQKIFDEGCHGRNYFAFNTRWHKDLTYCQSAGMIEQKKPSLFIEEQEFCFFDHTTGTFDWHYPFEVSGSIYRKNDALIILHEVMNKYGTLNNPNAFEGFIAQMVINKESKYCRDLSNWCFCPTLASAACIPANRVSSSSGCPVFDSGYSLDQLNNFYYTNTIINDEWYNYNIQQSAHIMKLVLKE